MAPLPDRLRGRVAHQARVCDRAGEPHFDNYFGTFPGLTAFRLGSACRFNPGVKGSSVVGPYHLPILRTQDLDHSVITARAAFNNGRMDGFVAAQQDRNLPGPLSLGYYDGSDLPYYWISPELRARRPLLLVGAGWQLGQPPVSGCGQVIGYWREHPGSRIPMTTIFDRLQGAG